MKYNIGDTVWVNDTFYANYVAIIISNVGEKVYLVRLPIKTNFTLRGDRKIGKHNNFWVECDKLKKL